MVSEKVYKMVGYLDNFYRIGQKHRNCLGILIMKNKQLSMNLEREHRCDNNESKISIFSIDIEDNKNKYSVISRYILKKFKII